MQHLRGFIDAAALVDSYQSSDLMKFHSVRLAFYLAPTIKQDAGQQPLVDSSCFCKPLSHAFNRRSKGMQVV